MKLAAAALALAVLAVGGSTGFTSAKTPRTIVDANHDNLLEYGPREGYTRRTIGELGAPGDRVSLIRFAQMTDTQLVDEESPARVEFIDRLGSFSVCGVSKFGASSRKMRICRWDPIFGTPQEIWDTWIVGAANFGCDTNSTVYAAIAADKNGDGIYNDAPNAVPDSDGDGDVDRKDLKAFGVASNIEKADFFIRS